MGFSADDSVLGPAPCVPTRAPLWPFRGGTHARESRAGRVLLFQSRPGTFAVLRGLKGGIVGPAKCGSALGQGFPERLR